MGKGKKILKEILVILAILFCAAGLSGCAADTSGNASQNIETETAQVSETAEILSAKSKKETPGAESNAAQPDEDGEYTSKDEVALYIHTYGKLPDNFITKKEAKALGWEGGALEPYAPGKSIGGDYFGNYEGLLPKKEGRTYRECDIDTKGKKRGAKRIIYSNDGLIYYTEDHYESFTLLYGTK